MTKFKIKIEKTKERQELQKLRSQTCKSSQDNKAKTPVEKAKAKEIKAKIAAEKDKKAKFI